jgi:hypothetical protein
MNKKNFPSLESIDDNDGGFNAGAEVMFDHTDTVAGYDYDYEQMMDGRKAENCIDAIEGAETEIASLESLLEAINDARDVGMEAYSAQFANIQISDAQRRYDVTGLGTMFPSMECFQGRQARTATSVSMEAIKETIAKIWEWIKKQFLAFIDMIRNFYRHLTKNLDLVVDQANTAKNIARKLKYNGGDSINLGRHGAKITVDGKIPQTLSEITSILNNVGAANRVPEEKFEKIRQDVEKAVTERQDPEHGKWVSSFTQEVPLPADFSVVNEANMNGVFDGAFKVYSSRVLPGDRAILIGVFGADNRASAYNFNSRSMSHGRVATHRLDVDRNTACYTLSSADTFTLCQRIVKTAASLKTSRDHMETHLRKTKETIDSIMRKYQGDGVTDKWAAKLTSWFYKSNAIYAGNLARHIEGVGYDVCVGFLALAKKSIAVAQEQEAKTGQAVAA